MFANTHLVFERFDIRDLVAADLQLPLQIVDLALEQTKVVQALAVLKKSKDKEKDKRNICAK
jgi:hypothetical protein